MKTFFITYGVGILGVASFVYWINPAGQWHDRDSFAQTGFSSHDVWVWPKSAINERLAKLDHLRVVAKPSVVILGSSRAFLIDQKMFRTGERLLNMSVSGAALEDDIAFWQALKDWHRVPKHVIIVLDPWIFNEYRHESWMSLQDYVDQFLHPGISSRFHVWRAQISYAYLNLTEVLGWSMVKKACQLMWQKRLFSNASKSFIVDEKQMPTNAKGYHDDGSVVYPLSTLRPHTSKEIKYLGKAFVNEQPFYCLDQWALNDSALLLFKRLIQDMTHHGVSVTLIVPPYQPTTWQEIKRIPGREPAFQNLMDQLLEVTHVSNVHMCNAIDSGSFGCAPTEFIDGMHAQRSCVQKMVAACLEARTDRMSLDGR